jgi:hypothetical protein
MKMKIKTIILLGLSVCLFPLLSNCSTKQSPKFDKRWSITELRALDAIDNIKIDLDLVAVYTRELDREFQIRLDWFDQTSIPNYDLYIALDTKPGGTSILPINIESDLDWDILLVIPASGSIKSYSTDLKLYKGLSLRVIRDPRSDTLTIGMNKRGLCDSRWICRIDNIKLQIFLTAQGSTVPTEITPPVRSDATPLKAASVLIAFWNTYPAYTPALALRRWDGAHTGPLGGRHGLYNLLRTAASTSTPIFLLDLKQPISLSSLDFAGYLGFIQEMFAKDMLYLADPLPDESFGPISNGTGNLTSNILDSISSKNQHLANLFGFSTSPFQYSPSGLVPMQIKPHVIFIKQQENKPPSITPIKIFRWRESRVITLPSIDLPEQNEQATIDGPSLELRRALISTAISENDEPGNLLILGGNLPASSWGDPQSARATFQYLANHPWIHILNSQEVQTFPTISPPIFYQVLNAKQSPGLSNLSAIDPFSNLLTNYLENNVNPISVTEWDAALSLYAPVYPKPNGLSQLRTNYLSKLFPLEEVNRWVMNPTPRVECNFGNLGDSICILASKKFIALIEPRTGSISFAFTFSEDNQTTNIHQIIAPSYQLITGLSDSSTWILEDISNADPSVITGAFVEPGPYQVTINNGDMIFETQDKNIRKTYQLIENGIRVEYEIAQISNSFPIHIPVVIDPWLRFRPGWDSIYQANPISQGYSWVLEDGSHFRLTSTTGLKINSFLDSKIFFNQSENPNLDYPYGHFLPFPMILIDVIVDHHFIVELDISHESN